MTFVSFTMHRHYLRVFVCRSVAARLSYRARQLLMLWLAMGGILLNGALGAQEEDFRAADIPSNIEDLERLTRTLIDIPPVYGASKFWQAAREAPSSVTLITSEDIKHYGYRTLADVLKSVPGLHVSYDRKYHFLGVRGFSRGDLNSRVLLLINGHRMNDSLSDGSDVGTAFLLDVDLIDRVEIIRGPGSVLYGNNAFFGVINVITRSGQDLQGVEMTGEYASYDTYKGRFSYGYRFKNDFEMLLSGSLYDSAGPDHEPVLRLDDDHSGNFFGSIRYKDLILEGGFIERNKGNPTGQYGTEPLDPRFRSVDERAYAELKYRREITNIVEILGRVYYDQNNLDVLYPLPWDPTLDQELQFAQWWGAELQLTKRLADRHTIALGGEYRNDFLQSLKYYTMPGLPPLTEIEQHTRNYGIFLQGDFAVLTDLHLNAGIRYDQYGDLDPAWNPRVALIYHPFDKTTLKAIYGTAFRAPNFFERILASGQPLEPETITTYELIYEQGIGKHLRSSVAGFFNRIDDLITFDNGLNQNQAADAKGVELSLEGQWESGLRGRISYTIQDVEDRHTGQTLTDAPNHLAKVNVSIPIYRDQLFAGVEFQYTGSRKTMRSTLTGGTLSGRDAPDFGVVNLTLFSRELVKNLEFSATVYNLLDRRYGDPSTPQQLQDIIWQDGRAFRLKMLYRF